MKEEKIQFEGLVIEALPNTMFKIEVEGGHIVLGNLAGIMRRKHIRIIPGDKIMIEVSPYDLNRGRIIKRL